jgi:outer membrane biosynthesis protein TonB
MFRRAAVIAGVFISFLLVCGVFVVWSARHTQAHADGRETPIEAQRLAPATEETGDRLARQLAPAPNVAVPEPESSQIKQPVRSEPPADEPRASTSVAAAPAPAADEAERPAPTLPPPEPKQPSATAQAPSRPPPPADDQKDPFLTGLAPAATDGPSCRQFGTSVHFVDSPTQAAALALKEQKLLFVLHVAGNFEDDKFT